ncbi:hypothetical protein ACWEQ3_01480 [Streptomyces mirabilis]
MAYAPLQPGQTLTAGTLNGALMAGGAVFRAFTTVAQSVTNTESGANAMVWDTIDLDLLGGWSAANPTRWTCTVPGWYEISGAVGFNSNTTGTNRMGLWYLNGGLFMRSKSVGGPFPSEALTVEARSVAVPFAAGDYVELIPSHNATAAVTTATGSLRPYLSITGAGPAS